MWRVYRGPLYFIFRSYHITSGALNADSDARRYHPSPLGELPCKCEACPAALSGAYRTCQHHDDYGRLFSPQAEQPVEYMQSVPNSLGQPPEPASRQNLVNPKVTARMPTTPQPHPNRGKPSSAGLAILRQSIAGK